MPRGPRLVLPDVPLHIVQRGVNRQSCFFAPRDYADYLRLLCVFADVHGCRVHAYCLMTNHVHLLVTPRHAAGCALLMKHLAQRHSKPINAKLARTGTLWEGRFYSALVASDEYALACYRYIELNPVRPGMRQHANQYPWSSYRANIQADPNSFVSPHPAYLGLGSDETHRNRAYQALCETPIQSEVLNEIRSATRSGHRVGSPRNPRGRRKMVTVTN